jgi:hypothetical protein
MNTSISEDELKEIIKRIFQTGTHSVYGFQRRKMIKRIFQTGKVGGKPVLAPEQRARIEQAFGLYWTRNQSKPSLDEFFAVDPEVAAPQSKRRAEGRLAAVRQLISKIKSLMLLIKASQDRLWHDVQKRARILARLLECSRLKDANLVLPAEWEEAQTLLYQLRQLGMSTKKKPKKRKKRGEILTRKRRTLIYTGGFETNRRRH